MNYIRLTEELQDNTGSKIVSCRFWNTDKCSIHNGGHCENCDVFGTMLAQLYMYESIFKEEMKVEMKSYKTI